MPASPRPPAGAPAAASSPSCRAALELLLRARAYAEQLRLDVWDFAVEIDALRAAGVDHSDLRLLSCLSYVEHAEEHTRPGRDRRSFRRAGRVTLGARTCF